MKHMNVWSGIGNVVRNAELRYTKNETAVLSLSIALNRKYQDKEEVSYIPVEIFGKFADTMSQYVKKGKLVGICGELRQDRWQNQDGESRSKIKIIASHISLLSFDKEDDSGDNRDGYINDDYGEHCDPPEVESNPDPVPHPDTII
jgi:single-strand DNA-binding protein